MKKLLTLFCVVLLSALAHQAWALDLYSNNHASGDEGTLVGSFTGNTAPYTYEWDCTAAGTYYFYMKDNTRAYTGSSTTAEATVGGEAITMGTFQTGSTYYSRTYERSIKVVITEAGSYRLKVESAGNNTFKFSIASNNRVARTFTEGEILYLNAGFVSWWQSSNAVQIATFDGTTRVIGTPAADPTKVAFAVPAGSYYEVVFSRHPSAEETAWNVTGAIALGGTTDNMVAEFDKNSPVVVWGNYSGGGMVTPDCPDALYILGNIENIGWNPGAQVALTKSGNVFTGTFTFAGGEPCYFALTPSAGTTWDEINAVRYGSQTLLTDGATVAISAGNGISATIEPGQYTLTVDWDAFTISVVRVGDVVTPSCPDALYLLGEAVGIGWNPGAQVVLVKTGNVFTGTFTFVPSDGNEICYFALTPETSSEWDVINANRFGSSAEVNTTEPVAISYGLGENTTATIAPGSYVITVDWDAFTISASTATTTLDNALVSKSVATKQVVNGQLVIIRDGACYNVQGTRL